MQASPLPVIYTCLDATDRTLITPSDFIHPQCCLLSILLLKYASPGLINPWNLISSLFFNFFSW